jgi:rare lipoprotein A
MRKIFWQASAVLLVALLVGCGTRPQTRQRPAYDQQGYASYYSGKLHGRKTASGETYDQHAFTAAHRSLAFGTFVEVENLNNGRSVRVRINDRGPFVRGRIIDLSHAAAKKLGMLRDGVVPVRVSVND